MNASLKLKVQASNYLKALGNKHPSLTELSSSQALDQLPILLEQLASLDVSADFQLSERALADSKAKFAYCWALLELEQGLDYRQRGQWLCRYADLTIDVALRCAWHQLARKHAAIAKALQEYPAGMPGLFVFGLGKLGGGDLNFSSDVDLVAYFDPRVIPVPDVLGKGYICHLVLQKMTQLLGQNGRSEFVWRVDWRLRPNASATTLAMSTAAAEEYYFFRASPWHRLALMKARIVAGDKQTGQLFLNTITPFIWRQNLDYRALDELGEIKNRINLEHPSLRVQRQWREPINDDVAGFNVKLGSGGIREIEFTANALQLVWGGRQYALRTPNTVQALLELATLEQLDSDLSKGLIRAYMNLRRIENAIQILANQHTHLIPMDSQTQAKLMVLLGEDDWDEFTTNLNNDRRVVSNHFEVLFAEQADQVIDSIEWPSDLSPAASDIVDSWDRGFHLYGVSNDMRQRLKPLDQALAEYLANASESERALFDASATVLRIHDFFRSLPLGEQYFRLLAEYPVLLDSIVPPLLYSPPMTTLLKQSPHIIDCYIGNIGLNLDDGFDSQYVLQAEQYEIRLERLRRFVNEQLYQLYLMFLKGRLAVIDFQGALSDLAEHTLELALRIVADNLDLENVPITVLGMGKVASKRMSPLSDLDLIFIFDPETTDLALASKFVARLQTAISTPMREGVVYELDTRLRPSGRSGAPTVSIDSFAAHQMSRAHTWEHIALVPSRVVAGDRRLEARIDEIKQQVLSTPRDLDQLRGDAAKMWHRIAQHRVKEFDSNLMFSKLRPGGLMQSEYLAACLILRNQTARPISNEASLKFDDLLQDAVQGTELQNLPRIIQFWCIQQLWERLLGFSERPLEGLPKAYFTRLLKQSGVNSLAELLAKKQRYAQQVIAASNDLFSDADNSPSEVEKWLESKVTWLDD